MSRPLFFIGTQCSLIVVTCESVCLMCCRKEQPVFYWDVRSWLVECRKCVSAHPDRYDECAIWYTI